MTRRLIDQLKGLFAKPHQHDWFLAYVQSGSGGEPPCEVMDCTCGARARVYKSLTGQPEIRIAVQAATSVENVLYSGTDNLLGDPQADQLRLLVNQG